MGRKFASLDTTNKLLLLLVLPVVVFILKELSAIFVPLVIACFFVLLFMPMLRFGAKYNIPRWVSIIFIFLIFFIVIWGCVWILQLTSAEFRSTDPQTWLLIQSRAAEVISRLLSFAGIDKDVFLEHIQEFDLATTLYDNLGNVFMAVRKTASIIFMSLFFLILLLCSSFNAQNILELALFKDKTPSIRTYVTIEKSISKFIFVKFLISFATGLSFALLCYFFGVKFAIFWGVLAFILNFIQMIGSIISTAIMCLFALTQIPVMSMLVLFIVIAIALQLLFGSVLEPIFMGRTFSINTVTIIIMLFFWGYVWNIPGMILAVPLTVMVKTVLEHFDKTRAIAALMS
ncbi:MAG: AI-2E family transporter [Bacteroidales bacterium]|nr:AI-2E family transporter [Bacteroidales bacterium]